MRLAVVLWTTAALAADPFDSVVKPLLTNYCIACHNAAKKTAGLDLDRLRNPENARAERDAWEKIAARIRAGQMPPPPIPKPKPEAAATVVEWAEQHVAALDKTRPADPGRVTARRLNRTEYNNTIRDLMGVDFRPAADFPLDDSGYGFDNIGDVLSLNPALMEKYLKAADAIVRAAIVTGPMPEPVYDRYELERLGAPRRVPADAEADRLIRRGGLAARHRFSHAAEYEFRVLLRGRGLPEDTPSNIVLTVDGRQVHTIAVDPGQGAKRTFETRFRAVPGEVEIGAYWAYPGPPEREVPTEPRAPNDNLWVDAIEIRGPYATEGQALPETHRRIFVCSPEAGKFDDECARRILAGFLRRAWRAPAAPADLDRLMRFVGLAREQGDSFEAGIALAIKAALVSPRFLFRLERDPDPNNPQAAHELDPFELASRLSYFLWSSMPDDALLDLAAAGKLGQPEVLAAEIRRMLGDAKSAALAENFAGQWLELRNLNQSSPDPKRFPEFDADLREAMRRETTLFFEAVMREDRSVLDFIAGNYTFVNERLATHYGIPGVTGRRFQRVELDGVQRSGVITQASVLTISSHPNRTSPVLRGLWLLENFLAAPPPPPPADVPLLKEEEIGKTASLRKQMEQHRADPNCAVCHSKMDALGFGLENYGPIGRWRTHDGDFSVDPAGELPGARKFTSPAEMKAILLEDKQEFVRCLAEKLMTYALGRGPESYDKPTLRRIVGNVASNGYRFSSMIQEIVTSPQFRMRRGEGAQKWLGAKQ